MEFGQRGNCTVAVFGSDKLWPPGPFSAVNPLSLLAFPDYLDSVSSKAELICLYVLIHIHLSNSLHCQCLSLCTCLTVIYVPAVLSVYSLRCKTTRRLSVMQLWTPKSCLGFIKLEEQFPSLWLNGNKVKLRLIRSCSPTKVTCSVETLPQRFLTFLIFLKICLWGRFKKGVLCVWDCVFGIHARWQITWAALFDFLGWIFSYRHCFI